MAGFVPLGFFSRIIGPNESVGLELEAEDVIITNISLGPEPKGTGRSILSLTYIDRANDDVDDYDDLVTGDSDDEDEDDEDVPDLVTADDKADMEEDEDDEDDSDAESDDSSDDIAAIKEVVIASLLPEKFEHANVNIVLNRYDDYELSNKGDNEIHVTGQYVVFPGAEPEDSEEDYDTEDEDSDDFDDELEEAALANEFGKYDPELGLPGGELTEALYEDDSDDISIADDSSRFEELPTPKKSAANADVSMTESNAGDVSTEGLSKNQKRKLAKKAKDAAKEAAPAAPETKKEAVKAEKAKPEKKAAEPEKEKTADAKKASKKVTMPSGLIYEDKKIGNGPKAKKGNTVSMRYIGKLESGKTFDQNIKGKPFSFKLGTGSVIAGWEQGIPGMAVGGERRLTIPAKLGYGKKGTDGIPPNATLQFDVKLLSIK